MLAVLATGTNPIPAGQNPNWPYLITEAGFGSGFNTPDSEITWTDVSSRVWSWDETTGIQFQLGQLQSTDLTMELDNYDGALTSTNTSSPYYPNVQPGTPVRIRAALGTIGGVAVNRWYILQRNAEQWGEEIDEAYRRYCPVTGTDLWAALSATPPTFYRSEVYEDGPYAWWPCDDQPGNSGVLPTYLLNAAIGNTQRPEHRAVPARRRVAGLPHRSRREHRGRVPRAQVSRPASPSTRSARTPGGCSATRREPPRPWERATRRRRPPGPPRGRRPGRRDQAVPTAGT